MILADYLIVYKKIYDLLLIFSLLHNLISDSLIDMIIFLKSRNFTFFSGQMNYITVTLMDRDSVAI